MRLMILLLSILLILSACSTTATTVNKAPEVKTAPKAVETTQSYQEALPTLETSYYANGDFSGIVKTKYDEKGRLLEQSKLNANKTETEKRIGTNAGNSWRITIIDAQSGKTTGYQDLVYDKWNNVTKETLLNAKEVPQSVNEYSYNDKALKTQWIAKTGADVLQAKTLYVYDKKGNNIKIEMYDSGDKLTGIYEKTFSDTGSMLSEVGKNTAGEITEQTVYTYDGKKLITKETVKPNSRVYTYSYSDQSDYPKSETTTNRGRVTEKKDLEYTVITKIKPLIP